MLTPSFPPLDLFQAQRCGNYNSLSASKRVCGDKGDHSSVLSAGKSFVNYNIVLK